MCAPTSTQTSYCSNNPKWITKINLLSTSKISFVCRAKKKKTRRNLNHFLCSMNGAKKCSNNESIACILFPEFNIVDLLSDTISSIFSAFFWSRRSNDGEKKRSERNVRQRNNIVTSFACGIDRSVHVDDSDETRYFLWLKRSNPVNGLRSQSFDFVGVGVKIILLFSAPTWALRDRNNRLD